MPASFLDAAGPYALPTNWGEVTTRQYCELDGLQLRTVEARASYFAGRPIQVNGLVADALAWMLREVPSDATTLRYPDDLGQETFLQVETIRTLLLSQPIHQCYCEVYGLFRARTMQFSTTDEFSQLRATRYAEHSANWPVTDTYPAVAHCLAELQRLANKYAALAEPDPTEAGRKARLAGSERLGIFGHLNIARHYAERFGVTVDAVYQWPWETVALYLWQDKMTAEIHDNLSKQKDE